ncbi:hypothetical protein [Glycomyces algeriensis]|uniref:Uncharacterized protein n=1 Tax=Glycomyces algeriensis TaxID=256037 RepID=A0A9W6G5E2_9ACTN|nr:hypothetical protein [Glycomyces algeriensis]MDA1367656.1 hypothetical protein [Glycomyces algeriensis]MDR7352997.1 hypothetical protein [Glycomyces algeriensis]GLI40687.1 hypothetical protein GALLR39Z86_05370 [Glycomyces algeriensis]
MAGHIDTAQRLTLAGTAVLAVAWLAWPSPDRPETAAVPEAAPTVWSTWDAEPTDLPGLIDGRAWTPLAVLDDPAPGTEALLGTDEAGSLLYVERAAEAEPTLTVIAEPGGVPGVVAAAATDERLAWLQTVPDPQGRVVSELWTAERGADGRPGEAALLTADTGDVITAGSAYDLQFAAEGLHWLSTARGASLVTEHRSIGVDGGQVGVVGHRGAWQSAAWPWLASAGSDSLGGAQLVRTDTGAGVKVFSGSDELTLCSATWCRLIVTAADGARVDLVRPDGSDRVTVAEGFKSAVSPDVGLIDRFEPLAEAAATTGDATTVTLFDLEAGAEYLVASSAGETGADARSLWWSTGTGELLEWHVLDLTDLA